MSAMPAPTSFSALAFLCQNQAYYRLLWRILGREWSDIATEAEWAKANIPGSRHGGLAIKLTDAQRQELLSALTKARFFDSLGVAPRDCQGLELEVEISGAKFDAMVGRLNDIKTLLSSRRFNISNVLFKAGHRPRESKVGEARIDGTLKEIISELTPKVLAHPWVQEELAGYDLVLCEEPALWEGPFATEFKLGILAFIVAFDGDIAVGPYAHSDDTWSLAGVPLRDIESCTLTLPNGTPVTVINVPAIERGDREPRPTTISATQYRMQHYPPATETVIYVSGPTHGYRVVGDYERTLHAMYPNVNVLGIWRAAADPAKLLNNALAEAAWLLVKAYEELLAL